MKEKFPQSDYTARASAILFKIDQGIPVYGIERRQLKRLVSLLRHETHQGPESGFIIRQALRIRSRKMRSGNRHGRIPEAF